MSRILQVVVGAVAAVSFIPAAHAAHTIQYNTDPSGSFTAAFENEDPTDPFNDIFDSFTVSLDGLLSGTLTTVGIDPINDLDFTLARILDSGGGTAVDYFPLTITGAGGNPDALEQGNFLAVPISAGTYTLRVAGNAPGANGSYSGTLAFSPTAPVPEPATWAMLLFGFGAIGYGLRRRKGADRGTTRVRVAYS